MDELSWSRIQQHTHDGPSVSGAAHRPHNAPAGQHFFFFSSRRRHTRLQGDWIQTCALPISLLDKVPYYPLLGLVLNPLGLSLFMRGELDEAEALARRSESLSAATGDRTALLCACLTHGLVQQMRGRPRIARDWLEKALDVGRDLDAGASRA